MEHLKNDQELFLKPLLQMISIWSFFNQFLESYFPRSRVGAQHVAVLNTRLQQHNENTEYLLYLTVIKYYTENYSNNRV